MNPRALQKWKKKRKKFTFSLGLGVRMVRERDKPGELRLIGIIFKRRPKTRTRLTENHDVSLPSMPTSKTKSDKTRLPHYCRLSGIRIPAPKKLKSGRFTSPSSSCFPRRISSKCTCSLHSTRGAGRLN